MLAPKYLEGCAEDLIEIYARFESDILASMAEKLARLGKESVTAKWQAQLLAEAGTLRKDVQKAIKKYAPSIQKEIMAIYNDALIKSVRADNKVFKDMLGREVSEIDAQIMLANVQKTYSDLSRLTITTALSTEKRFIEEANAAYMQTVTGAFSYQDALRNACDNLAKHNITVVEYNNGTPVQRSIEAAVRMNIITGVNQTAANITLNNCDELGCDLVETSAHIGARPSHEDWQGQVFSISGTNKNYRPFSVCRLGEADGICGINCRHSYYPYFEGFPRHYTDETLEQMKEKTVEYNGKKYSQYEAEQKLRGIERNVRYYKRRAAIDEAAGLDNSASRVKIHEWQERAKDFTDKTGLKRDSSREMIGTQSGIQPRGLSSIPQSAPAGSLIIDNDMKVDKPTTIVNPDFKTTIKPENAKTLHDTIELGNETITTAYKNGRTVLETLESAKPCGISSSYNIEAGTGSDKEAVNLFKAGLNKYPANAAISVVRYIEANETKIIFTDRGEFDRVKNILYLDKGENTAAHEIAHILEFLNSWILDLEREFYNNRTRGNIIEKLKKEYPDGNYKDDEIFKRDNFINGYIGRYYHGAAYELLSMGWQLLLNKDKSIIKLDRDYFNFIMGIMMRL